MVTFFCAPGVLSGKCRQRSAVEGEVQPEREGLSVGLVALHVRTACHVRVDFRYLGCLAVLFQTPLKIRLLSNRTDLGYFVRDGNLAGLFGAKGHDGIALW